MRIGCDFSCWTGYNPAMKILLSNDDGYQAEGLAALYRAVRDFAEVVVIAPEDNRSAASNSLTLRKPLTIRTADNGFHYVNGTPADCVHLAINGAMDTPPDMVVSGVNHGSNLGDDVIYSGTVGAAIEGRFLGLPAVAFSLVCEGDFDFSASEQVARDIMARLVERPLSADTILNVNIPGVDYGEIQGMAATRLGARHQSQPVIPLGVDGNDKIYQIGATGQGADAGPGTDFFAINENKVSITPLQIDMTRYGNVAELAHWLD